MKKSIVVAFGFVGTVIGAGFASGKEIELYFGETGIATPFLAAMLLGVFSYLFCEIGRMTGGDGYVLFGKAKPVFSWTVRISSALVFCTTIAACEEVVYSLFGVHGGSIATVALCLATLFTHKKVMGCVTVTAVLAIVILLCVVFFRSETELPQGKFSPLSAFTYAGMNMLTGGFFISARCKNYSKRDSLFTALLSFVLLAGLLLVVFVLVKNVDSGVFPVLTAADRIGLGTAGSVILYLAMYTTCIGTLTVSAEKNVPVALGISCIALLAACLGFETLITKIYPVIGTGGVIVSVGTVVLFLFKRKAGFSPVRAKAILR